MTFLGRKYEKNNNFFVYGNIYVSSITNEYTLQERLYFTMKMKHV